MTEAQERGRCGERLAADHLRSLGYRVLSFNYRCPFGEVDIVAEECGELVFVEVRSRSDRGIGHPAESIDGRKRDRLRRTAESYLQAHPERAYHCRVDVVTVSFGQRGSRPGIEVIRNAVTW